MGDLSSHESQTDLGTEEADIFLQCCLMISKSGRIKQSTDSPLSKQSFLGDKMRSKKSYGLMFVTPQKQRLTRPATVSRLMLSCFEYLLTSRPFLCFYRPSEDVVAGEIVLTNVNDFLACVSVLHVSRMLVNIWSTV